MFVMA